MREETSPRPLCTQSGVHQAAGDLGGAKSQGQSVGRVEDEALRINCTFVYSAICGVSYGPALSGHKRTANERAIYYSTEQAPEGDSYTVG